MNDNYENINVEIKQILINIIRNIDNDNVGETSNQQTYEIYRSENFHESQSNDGIGNATKPSPPPSTSVPPSYSSVIRQSPPTLNLNRDYNSIQYDNISSFHTRIPPPTYAEVNPSWSRNHIFNDDSWPNPVFVWCSRCYRITPTRVYSERMKLAHVVAVSLCLFGCWPCCLLPYCMESCKNTYHYCIHCNNLIGMYRPW